MVTITLLNNNKFVNKEKRIASFLEFRCATTSKRARTIWRSGEPSSRNIFFSLFVWHPLIFWTRFRGSNNSNKKKELNNKILLVLYDFLILWAGERFTLKPFYFMPSARGGFSLRSGTDGKIPGYFDAKKRWNTYILFF